MFAHAKFVNAPNVQLNPSNAEKIDEKELSNGKDHSNGTLNGTMGTSNPVYEYKTDTNNSNSSHHVYTTLDIQKMWSRDSRGSIIPDFEIHLSGDWNPLILMCL